MKRWTHQAERARTWSRTLAIEPLEERRILDAAAIVAEPLAEDLPWQNPVYRLDVNNDSVTNASDLLTIVNRILTQGKNTTLPVPAPNPVPFYYDANGDKKATSSDLILVINAILQAPSVEVSTLTTFTVDVTPQVTVKTTPHGTGALPDGTVVLLDVDLNNDGDFVDAGEFGHSQSTLYHGESTFSLSSPLARSENVYSVRLQARVKNTEAVFGRSDAKPLVVDTLTSDALSKYVYTPDPAYSSTIRITVPKSVPGLGSYTYYAIDMTSQTWRSADEVNLPAWRHWLTMYVPSGQISGTGLLLIDGGSNQNFTTPPEGIDLLGTAALLLGSVFINLKVVPNEPLVFADDPESRTEDEIIAYSMDKFLENIGQPGNDTWPVLVAMVKSAVRAMDTAQTVIPQVKPGSSLNDFIVTGYSKRGWTTWLTAAVDNRVRAIMPGVFDNLNQGPQMVHHYGAYGFFSEAVQPYNDMQIFDRILTPEAMLMSRIVDPYTYLANGRFDNMPKLIINSAGDEFFASDSAQFYFDDIPGEQNYLLYLPNTGHGLDIDLAGSGGTNSKVATSTITFTDAVLNNRTLPKYSWTVGQDGAIHVETNTTPLEVRLWQADNPTTRDFRHEFHPEVIWTSTVLNATSPKVYIGNVSQPNTGARAYFVELTFPNSNNSPIPFLSAPYVFTTEVRVKSQLELHPWPFDSAFDLTSPLVAAAASEQSAAALNATASALAMKQEPLDEVAFIGPTTLPAADMEADDDLLTTELQSLWMNARSPTVTVDLVEDGDELTDYLLDDCLSEMLA
jgi:PhoPQ-activated pathogenicity-related protein